MKSILSASLCTAVLAFAVPAMAQTDTSKPMHHHRHHSSRMDHMQGPKTKSKRAGDPTTEDLNAKSLAAARGGNAPTAGDNTTPMSTPSSSTAPGTGMSAPSGSGMAAPSGSGMAAPSGSGMAAPSSMPATGGAPSSGSTGTTTPSNAPGGQ